jgi:hypothetical protein
MRITAVEVTVQTFCFKPYQGNVLILIAFISVFFTTLFIWFIYSGWWNKGQSFSSTSCWAETSYSPQEE